MNTPSFTGALSTLVSALAVRPEIEPVLRERWAQGERFGQDLPNDVRAAADALSTGLAAVSHPLDDTIRALLSGGEGAVMLTWCAASARRIDVTLAPLLHAAALEPDLLGRAMDIARARVTSGPIFDVIDCIPLLGDGEALLSPENAEARARMEIMFWEAGARALELPGLGPWLWGSRETFRVMVGDPALGALRGRVVAARCLEACVSGLPPTTDPDLVGWTLQVLQPLLLHPEPLVWVHAARALGRLTGALEQLEGTLLDWVLGDSRVLRQRAITAFASLPSQRLGFLGSQLVAIVRSPDEDPWVHAAVAAATPYLFHERRDIWERLAVRILAGAGGAITARALARGLATLWRRGERGPEVERPFRALRDMARHAAAANIEEMRRWIEIITVTDVIDGAERDPLDLDGGLDNLMRVAALYDDEEADARAARCARALATTFQEARRVALGNDPPRQRAAAVNALEGSARALALRLWDPILTTVSGAPVDPPDLAETFKLVAHAPEEILALVKERRDAGAELDADLPLEVLALRLGGYALDACGDVGMGPGRGQTAHDACLWLRKLHGLSDGSRTPPPPLESALSAIFWRLLDSTRGTTLGIGDDVRWLGPFAAWWALVIDRPVMLQKLATALPMITKGALARCCAQADALRTALNPEAADGEWGGAVGAALSALAANDTELAHALTGLATSLEHFAAAAGPRPDLEALCLQLVMAAERLQHALANPDTALHPPDAVSHDDSSVKRHAMNAPRVAGLVARSIQQRELSIIDVWLASLGPVGSALIEASVRAAIRRTPPPPPKKKKDEPKVVQGYELVQPLGQGGIGSVWLVRKPGADRLFVLKIPKADALANASDTEREQILASFVEEAAALAGLYHPNVANIIDRGVIDGMPFLVLEYLIGADLKQYSGARPMTLFELKTVVADTCAGLASLHSANLVHRDIKPANIWLRLPLRGGEKFDAHKHRDPATVPPLTTVLIDFGMVRATRVPAETGGRFVAGTAGYIAPEQVLDPVELDPRADVYALAGTIYNVTTGRSFFDEIESSRDRIIAHMQRDPLEDAERLRPFPAAIAKLLRAATARKPGSRPMPMEFGREFAAAL